MPVIDYIREDLRGWQNYQVQPISGRKMDANESPFSLPEEVKKALSQWILEQEDLHYYPDTDNTILRESVGKYYGLDPAWVTCGVGSDQLIDLLTKVFLMPGESILVPSPSFSMYQTAAEINHGRAEAFPLDEAHDFAFPVDEILQTMERIRPKILFLCTPNNPTGEIIGREDLERILEKASGIVALDEAYGEFSGEDHLDLIRRYDNVVILKTFSKAYGLAGLRVGYALAQPSLIQAIDLVRAPYNLNTFSQKAASLLLGRKEYEEQIHWITAERDRMYRELSELNGQKGFYCYPSRANFLFMRSEVKDLGQKLLDKGLLVRAYGGSMKRYIRVSVAEEEANTCLITSLKEILA